MFASENSWGRIIVWLVSNLKRLELTKKLMLLFVCSGTVKSKLVKLETSRTLILPLTASVHCLRFWIPTNLCMMGIGTL